MGPRLSAAIVLLATAVSLWVCATRVHFSPDVGALLPGDGQGAALATWARAFGGGDLGLALVRGSDPAEVAVAAEQVADALRGCPAVRAAIDRIEPPGDVDPTLLWARASPPARAELEAALTPEGMRARLAETRGLLLAPGAGALAEAVRRDPLRLGQIAAAHRGSLGAGVGTSARGGPGAPGAGDELAAPDGTARLVAFVAAGEALRGADARSLTDAVEARLASVRVAHPGLAVELTGGHAIAAATERMIRRDLWVSGALSTLLGALAFALAFRRLRALVAVMPPLALGTLWTAAAAAAFPGGLSAIAVAFVSVVVGVGLDTGVHVYAALLEARRAGATPSEAIGLARRATARPALFAAFSAACAFGASALSSMPALRELGLLCAAGELLTAAAILIATPVIGSLLEAGAPPSRPAPAWTRLLARAVESHAAPAVLAIACLAPLLGIASFGWPPASPALFALRSEALEPVRVQQSVYELFGGAAGQWAILVPDASAEAARERADAIAEALQREPRVVSSVHALADFAPALATQKRRLAERDASGSPSREDELRAAIVESGLALEPFEPAVRALSAPSGAPRDALADHGSLAALLRARFLGRDGDRALAVVYATPRPGGEADLDTLVRRADPGAVVTGYARFEAIARETLGHDLPRVLLAAAALVAVAMAVALRRWRDWTLVAWVLAFEAAWVVLAVRWLAVPIHAYDALVLPALLGVTVDEAMFLVHGLRRGSLAEALEREGPSVAATALSTAAGFGALLACRFEGLVHLGLLGAVGSLVGLVAALFVVPVGARVFASAASRPRSHGGRSRTRPLRPQHAQRARRGSRSTTSGAWPEDLDP